MFSRPVALAPAGPTNSPFSVQQAARPLASPALKPVSNWVSRARMACLSAAPPTGFGFSSRGPEPVVASQSAPIHESKDGDEQDDRNMQSDAAC